ncbi:methylated-DNA--[protein]-cysteine S-methyltransferase [Paenibacillus rhizovicinus]|uniref:methylated-DNA--[protein]-cysteine S-methyltransferase n=1 Tax=Paenibacillus rhizovicinus TaxID=2704463 RepID=UPI00384ECC40
MEKQQQATIVYWDTFVHPIFQNRALYLAATDSGLCQITLPNEASFDTVRAWIGKRIPDARLVQDPERLSAYSRQLKEYCDGTRKRFTFPLDFRGTKFQNAVWQALADIPFGETRSYAEIARTIGNPKAVRAVGTANGKNPIPIVVPCHRVIGANRTLTGFRGGLRMKEDLLRLEGVRTFTNTGHERFQF